MSAPQARQYFADHLESVMLDAGHLPDAIETACQKIVQTLLSDGKLVAVGFGSQHWVADRLQHILMHGLQFERPPLPTLLLADNPSSAAVQITTLVRAQDMVIWFTAPSDILPASALHHCRDQHIPLVTIGTALADNNAVTQSLVIQESAPHKLLEKQLLVAHALSHCIEQQLFGDAL